MPNSIRKISTQKFTICTSLFIAIMVVSSSMVHAKTNGMGVKVENCKPSKWGADDEIGAANYVSAERTLAATKLIKQGISHPLGIVVDPDMPSFAPRYMKLQVIAPNQVQGADNTKKFGYDMTYNDDLAQLWFGTGPQIDGLGHLAEGNVYYNCNKAADFVELNGLKKLSVDKIPPLVARAVLIDMAEYFGVSSLKGGQAITTEDIQAAMKAQDVIINEGDIVLFHTGWTDAHLVDNPIKWVRTEPGLDNGAARYLASLNPMAVGADTWGLDVVPAVKGEKIFYGHVELLRNHGIYILETMNTGRLAKENIKEFMFVLGQARIKGTVQMIINPVAMW